MGFESSPDERRQELEKRVGPWRPRALHDVVDDVARRFGDRPLVLTAATTLSYDDVVRQSKRIAAGLVARGVGPGDWVAVVMANFADYVPLKIAVSRLGAVAVPLNYLYRVDELAYVLRQSRANVLVTMTAFGDLDHLAMLSDIAPGWQSGPTTELPELRLTVAYATGQGSVPPGVLTVGDLASSPDPAAADLPGEVSGLAIGDIVYTSGTTGSPKGAMISHDAFLRSSYATALTRAFEDGRRVLFSAPMFHMFSYVEGFLPVLWAAGAIAPLVGFTPDQFLRGVTEHRATEAVAVPTMTVALVEEAERNRHDLSSLVAVLSAAAPSPVWLWEKCRSVLGIEEMMTGYGMTESGAGITMSRPEDALETVATTIGRVKYAADAGVRAAGGALAELRTVDPVTSDVLQDGAEGELVIRSPTLMSGYWEKPEETAAALDGEWLHTGDVGRVRPDGFVELTGRTKELYKSGGELVMPKEVEHLIGRIPGVSQVFVIGIPDERWGEVGCAVVVPETGVRLAVDDVIGPCRAGLANFKVPKMVVFTDVGSLPMTASGKIQKFRLVREVHAQIAAVGPDRVDMLAPDP